MQMGHLSDSDMHTAGGGITSNDDDETWKRKIKLYNNNDIFLSGSETHSDSNPMGSGGKELTIHLHIKPQPRMCKAIPQRPTPILLHGVVIN